MSCFANIRFFGGLSAAHRPAGLSLETLNLLND
jgi:hypothetical protein